MAKDYSPEIVKAIQSFFEEDDWLYEPCDENGVIRTAVSLKCKMKKVNVLINVNDNSFSILSILPLNADENVRRDMAEFLTRANYSLTLGNFEMDFNDGEIRYKTSHYCGNTLPTTEQIERNFYVNVLMVDRYGDGIAKVLFGVGTPKEAIEECET